MQRITRRAFLATGAAGLAVAACSGPAPLDLREPGPTAVGSFDQPTGRGLSSQPTPTEPTGLATPIDSPTSAAARLALVAGPADGYLAVAPSVLHAGQTEAISFSLFSG